MMFGGFPKCLRDAFSAPCCIGYVMSWIVGMLAAEARPTHPIVAAMVASAVFAGALSVLFAWTRYDAIKDTERIERRAHMDELIDRAQAEAIRERDRERELEVFQFNPDDLSAAHRLGFQAGKLAEPEARPEPQPKTEPKPVDFKNPTRKERDIL